MRTADQQGMARFSDVALLAACADEGRALVTLDTDFANPLRYPPSAYAGVVVLRLLLRTTPADIEAALAAFVAAVCSADLRGRLLIVDHTLRVREYRPVDE